MLVTVIGVVLSGNWYFLSNY